MMGSGETSVLDRQQAQMKWRQQHIQQGEGLNYFSGESDQLIGSMLSPPLQAHQFQGLMTCNDQNLIEILNPGVIKQDPCNWKDLCTFGANALGSDFEMNYTVETISTGKNKESFLPDKLIGRESFKRRKTDKNQSLKAVAEEERKDKKQKGCQEEVRTEQTDTKKTTDNTNSKKEHSTDTSKITEDKKPDYIHVRARRGQATDSHSLAERVRREKISERMKYLQNLVPGCDKITGKAGMLDEIINYVQSLQKQVEFLSMKLAVVHPRLDNLFTKEMFQSSPSNFPPVGITSEVSTPSILHHFNLLQLVSPSGLEIGINPSDMVLRRTTNSPVSIPKTPLNSSSINQVQTCPTWDGELQSLYAAMEVQQGRSASFMSPPFMGFVEGSNPRMEI